MDPGRKASVSLDYLREMDEYFASVLEYRRRHPGGDMLTGLLQAEVDGEHLSEKDICNFARLLLVAGNETTTNLIGNAVLSLLEFPDQMALLRANPHLIPSAIEEALRYRSPVVTMPRVVRQEIELGGQLLKAGQRVLPFMASANRDEAKFPDAERFDITRDPNPHLAFGHGVHHCLGAPLGRTEGRIALSALTTLTGMLAIGVGLLYALRAFGPTEAEVSEWGRWCVAGGVAAAVGAWLPLTTPIRWLLAAGLGLLALAQLPPIMLWFFFHGRAISDPFPPSWFTGHWLWSLPHIMLMMTALVSMRTSWTPGALILQEPATSPVEPFQ